MKRLLSSPVALVLALAAMAGAAIVWSRMFGPMLALGLVTVAAAATERISMPWTRAARILVSIPNVVP